MRANRPHAPAAPASRWARQPARQPRFRSAPTLFRARSSRLRSSAPLNAQAPSSGGLRLGALLLEIALEHADVRRQLALRGLGQKGVKPAAMLDRAQRI